MDYTLRTWIDLHTQSPGKEANIDTYVSPKSDCAWEGVLIILRKSPHSLKETKTESCRTHKDRIQPQPSDKHRLNTAPAAGSLGRKRLIVLLWGKALNAYKTEIQLWALETLWFQQVVQQCTTIIFWQGILFLEGTYLLKLNYHESLRTAASQGV